MRKILQDFDMAAFGTEMEELLMDSFRSVVDLAEESNITPAEALKLAIDIGLVTIEMRRAEGSVEKAAEVLGKPELFRPETWKEMQ